MAVPTVTTQSASSVGLKSAVGNGNITVGAGNTRRGFQFNTVEYPDKQVFEDGSFGTGAFALTMEGLTPGQKYWYRAFAENPDGVGYGGWTSFTCIASTYNITINGIDRTADVIAKTLIITDTINDQVNTCNFTLDDLSGNGVPSNDEEIVITLNDGTKIFGGFVVNSFLENKAKGGGAVKIRVKCTDYTRLLDQNLVHKSYLDMTDKAIIEAIIDTYAQGSGITTNNVLEGVTIDQKAFNYIQISEAFRQIAELTGRNWYIDYDKDIHYFPLTTDSTPFDIDSAENKYWGLNISKDASQIKNRIYVRGGTKLSDATTYLTTGDGEKIHFVLPDKPHSVTVEVDRGGGFVEESVGIKNVDTSGFKWYLNFQEKYIEQDVEEDVLTSTDTFKLTYEYDIPILVAVENTASIIANGQKEYAIFDKQITTTQSARDRATAELTDYADSIIEGSFKTWETGFVSGQYININLSDYGINDDYIVQKVVAISIGAGTFRYEIFVASAKTLGIIKFLIELLEANKNLIELDDDEVVDELLQSSDSLLSDSLMDSLVIDSTGPYHVYQNDSAPIEDLGIGRWKLSQFKY